MKSWILIAGGWSIALLALAGIARIPGSGLDLYVHDVYVAFSKSLLRGGVIVVLVLPLSMATVRRLRAR
jgi:hypothetical protein